MFEEINRAFDSGKEIINFEPISLFEVTIANIINQLLFGFGYHQPEEKMEFSKIKDVLAKHMRMATWPSVNFVFSFYKIFRFLPFFKPIMDEFFETEYTIEGYCLKQIDAHKRAMELDKDDKAVHEDYVEDYLREAAIL